MAGNVTVLLHRLQGGEADAGNELFGLLYGELRALAGALFRSQKAKHTLQPTALVHEAYLKMLRPGDGAEWKDRVHFFAVAARAMRQILVNHARDASALKRGGGQAAKPLTLVDPVAPGAPEADILAVHEALEDLERLDERQARLAELRFFAGLNNKEIAEVLGISLRSVELDWKMAKDHLTRLLG